MPREAPQTSSPDGDRATWGRLRHARLQLGREWPSELHTQAADEYLRLDRLRIPAAQKIAALRVWMEQRSSADEVARSFEHMAQLAERYGAVQPVKRLRVVEPE